MNVFITQVYPVKLIFLAHRAHIHGKRKEIGTHRRGSPGVLRLVPLSQSTVMLNYTRGYRREKSGVSDHYGTQVNTLSPRKLSPLASS